MCLGVISDAWDKMHLLSMLDTPVLTACGNMDSTFREEPPKTVTFCENLGHSCNIDDPERNRSITWETTELTTTASQAAQRSSRSRKKLGSRETLNSDP